MNLWKPLALVSTSALVLVIGYQAASAGGGQPEPSSIALLLAALCAVGAVRLRGKRLG